jgi:hypothetical protein
MRLSVVLAIAVLSSVGCGNKTDATKDENGVETRISVINGVKTMTKSSWYHAPDGKCAYQHVKTYVEKDGSWIEVK